MGEEFKSDLTKLLESFEKGQKVSFYEDEEKDHLIKGEVKQINQKTVSIEFEDKITLKSDRLVETPVVGVGEKACFNIHRRKTPVCGIIESISGGFVTIEYPKTKGFSPFLFEYESEELRNLVDRKWQGARDSYVQNRGEQIPGARFYDPLGKLRAYLESEETLEEAHELEIDLSKIVTKDALMTPFDLEKEKNKGKSAGHIYYHYQLLKALKKKPPTSQFSDQKNYYKHMSAFEDIINKTTTYEDLRQELRSYFIENNINRYTTKRYHSKLLGGAFLSNVLVSTKSGLAKFKQAKKLDENPLDYSDLDPLVMPKEIVKGEKKEREMEEAYEKHRGLLFELYKGFKEERFRFEGETDFDRANNASIRLRKDFSLRSVEFGNSMPDSERVGNAKMAYGALMDLSDVTKVPVDFIGLGRPVSEIVDEDFSSADPEVKDRVEEQLSPNIARTFGSRGRKGAAHYDIKKNLININRKNGMGALAHEWAHGLDYALFKASEKADVSKSPIGRVTSAMYTIGVKQDPVKFPDETGWLTDREKRWYGSKSKTHALRRLGRAIVNSNFCNFGKIADKLEGRSMTYWGFPTECFARAFESYSSDKSDNKYLAFPTKIEPDAKDWRKRVYNLYPQGEEREEINEEFDSFFDRMQDEWELWGRVPSRYTDY